MATRNLEEAHNTIIGLLETAWDATGIVGNIPKLKAPHAPPHIELSMDRVPGGLVKISEPIQDMYNLDVITEYLAVYQFLDQNEEEIVNIDTPAAVKALHGRPGYQQILKIAKKRGIDDEVTRIFDKKTEKGLRKNLVDKLKTVLADKIKPPTGK